MVTLRLVAFSMSVRDMSLTLMVPAFYCSDDVIRIVQAFSVFTCIYTSHLSILIADLQIVVGDRCGIYF